jgi:hypothetical protein
MQFFCIDPAVSAQVKLPTALQPFVSPSHLLDLFVFRKIAKQLFYEFDPGRESSVAHPDQAHAHG